MRPVRTSTERSRSPSIRARAAAAWDATGHSPAVGDRAVGRRRRGRPDPVPRGAGCHLLTGVAVTDAVRAITGIEAGLKWPNDIVVSDGKLGGILAEVAAPAPVVVIGLGLNVTLTR